MLYEMEAHPRAYNDALRYDIMDSLFGQLHGNTSEVPTRAENKEGASLQTHSK